MTQQPWTGSRRVLLALGGLSLLSACAKPQTPTQTPTQAPATTPSSPSPSPSPTPSPTPTKLPPIAVQKEPRYVVPTGRGPKVVALTFDDGPHPSYTPQVLKLLRKHHIKATFFVIGQQAAAHPDLIRSIVDDGHTVGTHTWSHADLHRLAAGRVRTEVGRAVDTVAATVGRIPHLFRAPYGSWSHTVFEVCASLGQSSIAWDVDPRDWDNPGAGRIRSKILDQVGNRSIVLTHDGGGDRSQTVRALRGVLPVLLDSGYRFVGV
ncbi:polysaccharide deacetylase family protein [Actinoplanes sp. LDG1-06]|uniref:Polysaccharide deacetylase family protein n=1 Tax=Paractinoplanes ovalisporus TaxID=2810368 RepID=A0ABS2AI10_9ACTN|nr:polysaccharide deacetylase family protein [Actinoplanes ovalisporus]MBM2619484.1 polysaccharide deacetylase family protein [Actinoplanes ovalisporus]